MNPDIHDLPLLEEKLGYIFQDRTLLITSLTHKSFTNENPGLASENNERMEFIGDAVLSLIVSHYLYKRHSELNEGSLSKIRANLVNENCLASVATKIGLGTYIFLGKGEEGTGGREKVSLLSDVLEAVIGGIYLDRGMRFATQTVLSHFKDLIQEVVEHKHPFDFKTTFQEVCQERFGVLPEYHLTRTSGPDHNRLFVMELTVNSEVYGVGSGKNKKEAQQQAAMQALEKIKKERSGQVKMTQQKRKRAASGSKHTL